MNLLYHNFKTSIISYIYHSSLIIHFVNNTSLIAFTISLSIIHQMFIIYYNSDEVILMNLEIKEFKIDSDDYRKSLEIRDEVFRKPQGLSIYDDDLSDDKISKMYAGFIDNEMVAMAFLKPVENEGVVRAVIVLEKYRGQGFGVDMMNHIHKLASDMKLDKLTLKGRTSAEGFYKSLGYTTTSEVFDHKGVPHVMMEMKL